MTYRDEHSAARERLRALEREKRELEERVGRIVVEQTIQREPLPTPGMIVSDRGGVKSVRWTSGAEVDAIGCIVLAAVIMVDLVAVGMLGLVSRYGLAMALVLAPVFYLALRFTRWYLGMTINTTEVRLADGRLTVHEGPIRLTRAVSIPVEEVEQLYVAELDPGQAYDVVAIDRTGRRRLLLEGMTQSAALFLESFFERSLGIVDEPVEGEHGT